MDSRERVLLALDHQEPDRIPIDFWASKGFLAKLEAQAGLAYEQFLDAHDVDLRYLPGPQYIGPPLIVNDEPVDIWGVPRTIAEVPLSGGAERYEEVIRSPLADVTAVEEVLAYDHWPSPDWFDYRELEAQCRAIHTRGRATVFMGDRTNRVAQLKPALYLRGMERALMDMALTPELLEAILSRVRQFYLGYLERILEAGRGQIDIVLTGDDFGMQQGLLVSLPMWDRFVRPGFAEYVALIRSYGAKSMHHTCGSVADVVPRLVECGLDALQSLQPEAHGMEAAGLKRNFGDRLSFQGGVSVQQTMPRGSTEDIRAEVKRLAEALGPGGGYIFCTAHNVQADVPVENVLALMQAYHEYGRYQ
jgi:uroporphyrinogen decarboxylase